MVRRILFVFEAFFCKMLFFCTFLHFTASSGFFSCTPDFSFSFDPHDIKGGIPPAKQAYERYPSIQKFCADAGYRGTFVSDVKEPLGLNADISEKIKPHQWEKLSWRCVEVVHTIIVKTSQLALGCFHDGGVFCNIKIPLPLISPFNI